MKLDERNPKKMLIPPFLFLWQLRQSYGGHFDPKMAAKIKKSSDLGEIWFPSRL
jgi:hypothetical protein